MLPAAMTPSQETNLQVSGRNSETAPVLVVRDLSAVFRNGNGGLQALDRVTFSVYSQEFVCVLGPSGSGKSTLLRILAGLLSATDGVVNYQGESVHGPRRGVGLVFQKASLMPWRTVLDNITLPLELQRAPEDARLELAPRSSSTWWVCRVLKTSCPAICLGGMAQRVTIAARPGA